MNIFNKMINMNNVVTIFLLPIYMIVLSAGKNTVPQQHLGENGGSLLLLHLKLIVLKTDMSLTKPVAGEFPPYTYIFPLSSIIPLNILLTPISTSIFALFHK